MHFCTYVQMRLLTFVHTEVHLNGVYYKSLDLMWRIESAKWPVISTSTPAALQNLLWCKFNINQKNPGSSAVWSGFISSFHQQRTSTSICSLTLTPPSLHTPQADPPESLPSPSESPLSTGQWGSYTASSEGGWPLVLSFQESLPLQARRRHCRLTGDHWPAPTEASDGGGDSGETGWGGRECWVTTINISSICLIDEFYCK